MTLVRRGVILPVVLLVLILLGLLGAMFAFRVNADLASTRAVAYRLQTRLAAEAGVERVKQLLRESRFDIDRWYHNPDELHRVIVWTPDGDETVWGSNDELEDATVAYRFSIVADDPTDDEEFIRFGITDESAKLNLNTATEAQLLILVRAAVAGNEEIDPQAIVNAILDWRDPDPMPRGGEADTEAAYYRTLPKPYFVKNGPFDTVEELLLVKGVTGQILYGEDWDRNGLLTPNEDDGDESFPPDNQDSLLNRGLYPFLTVHSAETNVSNDNRPRVYLFGDAETLREELTAAFPDEPEVVDYVVSVTRSGPGGGGGNGPNSPANAGPGNGGPGPGQLGDTENDDDEVDPEGGVDSEDVDEPADGNEPAGTNTDDDDETDDEDKGATPIRTPASLLLHRSISVEVGSNPLTPEHLPVLLDRTTTVSPEQQTLIGLINVNMAPRLVLQCIDGLTDEQVEAILEARERVPPEEKTTPAWLVTEEAIDLETLDRIAPQITARGQRFTIEALGYADHVGMVTRLEVILDMVGPIAQTLYYRDLSYLGGHYPIREEDLENLRVQ